MGTKMNMRILTTCEVDMVYGGEDEATAWLQANNAAANTGYTLINPADLEITPLWWAGEEDATDEDWGVIYFNYVGTSGQFPTYGTGIWVMTNPDPLGEWET
jgi:hypothetical protein